MNVMAWIVRLGLIFVAFILYLLGLMKIIPVLLGSFLLFMAIFFAIRPYQKKQKFKGFRL
ncbi:hypothetical protein [Alkalicoccobacillus porphyridii]|uniref:Uncharacterized protein n=1 Tax=Alkalicoccobacillus porphyridii TaxID=2597270 RepID=A0A553ZXB9_9BACI|nr:hypothetical protein [Alkalicoccobacillus porphyridii]TSB46100.1 hypothetical protein FN960_12095 [Alkalicoccobacillus porphyridii]